MLRAALFEMMQERPEFRRALSLMVMDGHEFVARHKPPPVKPNQSALLCVCDLPLPHSRFDKVAVRRLCHMLYFPACIRVPGGSECAL